MRVVLIGAGSRGTRTARLIVQRGYEVVVIESDPARAGGSIEA